MLRDAIIREIEFIKENIEEYQEKSKKADTMTMTFYYDGLVAAFQTTLSGLEFILAQYTEEQKK